MQPHDSVASDDEGGISVPDAGCVCVHVRPGIPGVQAKAVAAVLIFAGGRDEEAAHEDLQQERGEGTLSVRGAQANNTPVRLSV
jgi:hypothetical protein